MRGVLGGAEFPHDLRRGEHELGDPPQGTTHPPWPSTLLRGGRDAPSGMQLGGQLPSGPARLHPQRERGEGGKKQFYENVRLLEPGETFANFRIPDCSRRHKKKRPKLRAKLSFSTGLWRYSFPRVSFHPFPPPPDAIRSRFGSTLSRERVNFMKNHIRVVSSNENFQIINLVIRSLNVNFCLIKFLKF